MRWFLRQAGRDNIPRRQGSKIWLSLEELYIKGLCGQFKKKIKGKVLGTVGQRTGRKKRSHSVNDIFVDKDKSENSMFKSAPGHLGEDSGAVSVSKHSGFYDI